MDGVTDDELIQNILKNNCKESWDCLIDRHSALFFFILNKYTALLQVARIDINEIKLDKKTYFIEAFSKYDPTKGTKFSTWLGHHFRFRFLNMANRHKNNDVLIEDEEIVDLIKHDEINTAALELREYALNLISQLEDKRISAIFKMRYGEEKISWQKIGRTLGMSHQTAMSLHKKGIEIVRKKSQSVSFQDTAI